MERTVSAAKLAGAVLAVGLAVAACVPSVKESADATQTNQTYENTSGSVLINTKYGQFGPVLSQGAASITTTDGSVNSLTLQGSPVADGSFAGHMNWRNIKVSLVESSVSGTVTSTSATLNATGLEMDILGSICVTYHVQYCDTFNPGDPLKIYLSQGQTVTATGQVAGDGSFGLNGNATVKVDPTTWTGWALGYIIDGSQLTLNLERMKRPTPTPTATPTPTH